ncbi:MAG: hypothetical protein AB7J35_06200 [Dehalococcoidia bacterium]
MRVLSLFFPRLGIQLARAANPSLAGRPLGLLAGEGDGALLSAVSVEATADGIEAGMTSLQARQRCPGIALERDNARECLEQLEAVSSILRTRATSNVAIVSRNSIALSLSGLEGRFANEEAAAAAISALARSWSGLDVRAGIASTLEQAECAARKARRFPLVQPDEGVTEFELPRYEAVTGRHTWETHSTSPDVVARIHKLLGTMQPMVEAGGRSFRTLRVEIEQGPYRSSMVLKASQPLHRAAEASELLRSRLAEMALDGTTAVSVTLDAIGPSVAVEPWRATAATVHQLSGPAVPVQRRLLRAS